MFGLTCLSALPSPKTRMASSRSDSYKAVLVTAPSPTVARKLARAIVEERLAACASLVPGVESHYRWKGKLEKSRETLLIIKTTAARLTALRRRVLSLHPYETPEFVVLPIQGGSPAYLEWITDCVSAPNASNP